MKLASYSATWVKGVQRSFPPLALLFLIIVKTLKGVSFNLYSKANLAPDFEHCTNYVLTKTR